LPRGIRLQRWLVRAWRR